eukprot:m.1065271 g.1065271  ORF g.1065271 m.1065271 type:complete len:498 (-) comp24219_c1_seq13:831-2324(-)
MSSQPETFSAKEPVRNVRKKRVLWPQPLFDEPMVLAALKKEGVKEHNAYKMWRGILHDGHEDVNAMDHLPKALKTIISQNFALLTSTVVKTTESKDSSTTKLLVKLQDGHLVESVIMRYGCVQFSNSVLESKKSEGLEVKVQSDSKFRSNPRATLCISSQVGCSMGCTFCATGTMGLLDNLCAGEILEQLYHANKIVPIRNVVFMGMGEPLDNYSAVLAAIRGMTDVQRFSLKYTQVSVSTVGVVPRLLQLARDVPKINLALSLHAPNQEIRTQIVPSAKAWHIDRIMDALDEFLFQQNAVCSRPRNVLIEYVLIANVNDSDETAHELGLLLRDRTIILNVIPYNPTEVPFDYKPPSVERTDRFNNIVRTYGVRTIIRQELGQDIDSACGQLVVKTLAGKTSASSQPDETQAGKPPPDVEDIVGGGQGVFSPPSSPPIQRARLRRQAKAKREEVSTTANEVQQTQRSQNVFTTLLKVIFVCFMAYVLVVLDRIQGQR